LFEVAGAWSVLVGIAFLLTLGVGMATLCAVVSILRLRRDATVIEAAENFEAVDLTTVVKRYVPAEHQTNIARDETAIAKQVIATQRPRWRWIATILGTIFVCGAIATVFLTLRHLEATAVARLATKPPPNLDVLKYVQGVWGVRADFLESCSENPQTISVAPDRKTLTLRFASPSKLGSATIADMTFDIVSVKPNMLVVLWANPPVATKPVPIDVQFIDANTMSWSPSNSAMLSSGAIERCPSSQHAPTPQ
jgi:hypothetical protein